MYIACRAELGLEPSFDVAVVNVTVVVGQTAVLPCSIEFLGNFKVTQKLRFSTYNYVVSLLRNYW